MVPAVGDFAQGMLTMVPLQLSTLETVPTGAMLHDAIADHYAAIGGGVVTVKSYTDIERSGDIDPQVNNDTDEMTLFVCTNDARAQAVLIAVYDNLGKGASGAAVQNLNLMIGA